jgi:hypothetical protein
MVSGMGVGVHGAYDRRRGMMLSLLGRQDETVVALEAGLAAEQSLRSPPLIARTRIYRV